MWIDDDTVYSIDTGINVVKIDLHNARADIIVRPGTVGMQPLYRIQSVLPGNHFVDIVAQGAGPNPKVAAFQERFLLELATGKKTTLPFDDRAAAQWFDENTCIYTRSSGGLAAVGTWLYDRTSATTKRLTGKQIEFTRAMLTPDHSQLWTVTTGGGQGYSLNRLKLDGSGLDELGPSDLSTPMQLPAGTPLDLGLAGASTDLWKPPVIDPATLTVATPASTATPAPTSDSPPAPGAPHQPVAAAPPHQPAANPNNPAPPPSPVDQAAQQLNKAQDAANRLHNLFGH
ncbi:MAG TPA: hypothetical protein VH253_03430 [Phycisphaerae bacterium]|nr:hypothetical protein [Phycisphaerae bacterium]